MLATNGYGFFFPFLGSARIRLESCIHARFQLTSSSKVRDLGGD